MRKHKTKHTIFIFLIAIFSLLSVSYINAEEYIIETEATSKSDLIEIAAMWVQTCYPRGEAYVVEDTDVYDKPEGEIIGTIEKGTPVFVSHIQESDWADTEYGYIFAGYISYHQPTSLVITAKDENAKRFFGTVNTYLNMVPEKIIDIISNDGYYMELTSSDIGAENVYGEGTQSQNYTGCTMYPDKIICIETLIPVAIETSVIHEIGHAFDFVSGFESENDTFQMLFEVYKDEDLQWGNYFQQDNYEMFAEAFHQYICFGEYPFEKAPELYVYMKEKVNDAVQNGINIQS